MSESIHTSPAVLLDLGNVGIVSGILLPSCIEAELLHYFICSFVMAAIFDVSLTPRSESVHTSPAVLLDHEHVGMAFGITLLSCIIAEILRHFISTSGYGGIFDLPLTLTSECVHTSSAVLADIENVAVVFGILLLSCTKAEI